MNCLLFMRLTSIIAFIALLCTSGCATVLEGRSQTIAIDTQPQGANCVLRANDEVLGIIPATPGSIQVDKSKYDIVVECSKEGYIKSKIKNHSDYAATGIGNMAMMQYSFIGNAIDSATGASNKYNSRMLITLDEDKDYKARQFADATPPTTPAALPARMPFATEQSALPIAADAPPAVMAVPVTAIAQQSLPSPAATPTTAPAPPTPPAATIQVAATPAAAPSATSATTLSLRDVQRAHPGAKVTRMPSSNEIQLAQLSDAECTPTRIASDATPW